MRFGLPVVVMASLLLTACGRGSEDFAFAVDRPADKVQEALGKVSLTPDLGVMFPGLKVVRTEPAPGEVLFTIPGDGEYPVTIKLTFEPSADGKTSVLHAAIDVPDTKVTFAGKTKYISEAKVETLLGKLLRKAAQKLEHGQNIDSEKREFAEIMTILAITTDSRKLRLANEMAEYPEWYMEGLGWLMEGGEGPQGSYGDPAIPDDPGAASRRDEYRQQQAEREERSKAEEAAEPMDDARGDSARGDYAGPSDY